MRSVDPMNVDIKIRAGDLAVPVVVSEESDIEITRRQDGVEVLFSSVRHHIVDVPDRFQNQLAIVYRQNGPELIRPFKCGIGMQGHGQVRADGLRLGE